MIQEDNFDSCCISKVFGLKWNKPEDCFIFSFQELLNTVNTKPTKRDFLKFFASFIHPLGLLNVIVIVRPKILFQSICKLELGWNVIIGGDVLNEWDLVVLDLISVTFVCVPSWHLKLVDKPDKIKLE